MKKLSVITFAITAAVYSSAVFAETKSGQSQGYENGTVDIRIDKTESGMRHHAGPAGAPGIGYRGMRNGKTISFAGLKNMVEKKPDNVYVLESGGSSHGGMGKFQFSQVADAEVYFGDWSQTGEASDQTHTAYFSGENSTAVVPTSGQAVYSVEGINQFDGEAKLTGTFNADFADKSYTGALQGESLKVSMNGDIIDQGKFVGAAIANETIAGLSEGQFFGDNAEHVAGITSFEGHRELDTAFGGKKAE